MRWLAALLLAIGAPLVVQAVDHAAGAESCASSSGSESTGATTGVTGILISGEQQVAHSSSCPPVAPGDESGSSSGVVAPRDSGLDPICVRDALSSDRNPFSYCDLPSDAPAAASPVITNALVLRALRRVDLPGSELGVQPPGGETLVNFETNFFTDAGAFSRSVRLLGRRVDLRVWPSRFHWVFGDGADLASTSAGARYPDLEITHAYEASGSVSPSVETTYAARYRVDGGPWREVEGTVTVPGDPVRLRVRTARPVLVSHG